MVVNHLTLDRHNWNAQYGPRIYCPAWFSVRKLIQSVSPLSQHGFLTIATFETPLIQDWLRSEPAFHDPTGSSVSPLAPSINYKPHSHEPVVVITILGGFSCSFSSRICRLDQWRSCSYRQQGTGQTAIRDRFRQEYTDNA